MKNCKKIKTLVLLALASTSASVLAAPGEDKKFNIGGAMLAQKSGYPVIPLAHNAGEFWPRYSFLKYPGTITVKIGPVIESTNKKAKEINSEAEAWIAQAMKQITTT